LQSNTPAPAGSCVGGRKRGRVTNPNTAAVVPALAPQPPHCTPPRFLPEGAADLLDGGYASPSAGDTPGRSSAEPQQAAKGPREPPPAKRRARVFATQHQSPATLDKIQPINPRSITEDVMGFAQP